MMAEIVARCSKHRPDDQELADIAAKMNQAAQKMLDYLFAAIPFMLLRDVSAAMSESGKAPHAGPPIGGILIMHPLHILSGFVNVMSPDRIAYLRGCLKWMAREMGLGSAWEMHEASGMPCMQKSIVDAHTIVWAGMMQ